MAAEWNQLHENSVFFAFFDCLFVMSVVYSSALCQIIVYTQVLQTVLGTLWSADVQTCVVPLTYSSYGDRTFAAAGPRLWNSTSSTAHPDCTYGLFRRQLKGNLFENHGHVALWLLICSALEKHLLTYLLIYLLTTRDIARKKTERRHILPSTFPCKY